MKTPQITCLVALLIACPVFARAQTPGPIVVPYLPSAPAIDGVPEAAVLALPARPLALESADGDAAGMKPPSIRLAYGTRFLYALVEIDTPRLAERDRAYQNGDGVVMVVAAPKPGDQPADEFYVLGFSPGTPAARWQQRFVWYRNVELEMRPLEESMVATSSSGGRSFFEVLVPWQDVYPFHPWLSDAVGFNVCVTRALSGTSRARYCAVGDSKVGSEQSLRRYARLSFARARPGEGVQAYAVLDRNHAAQGSSTRLRVATLAARQSSVPVTARVATGEGSRMAGRQVSLPIEPGVHVQDVEVPTAALRPAGYGVTWDVGDGASCGRIGLTVLPSADPPALTARLNVVREGIRPGTFTTLAFRIEEVDRRLRTLRPYDTAAGVREALDQLVSDLRDVESGRDPIAEATGVLRRGFRSKVDGQLQPYSVRIPPEYRTGHPMPLLVFLHGSGEDDREALVRDWFPPGYILLAPRGRGTSNWYTADHAQEDIREAVEDVVANYSIDTSRVVLSGFSMGGYGVYRTYKEDPSRYRALAVFSGIPRLPGGEADAPDFLNKENLAAFARVPLFIFHGAMDRNCPIEQTRMLVERLKKTGAQVEFELEDDKGHEAASPATVRAFHAWLLRVMQQ